MTELTSASRRVLEQHLAQIREAMTTKGAELDEIEMVVGAVEERVLETATQTQCTDPTSMRGLLRSMDSPDDYGAARGEPRDASATLAHTAFVLGVGGPLIGIAAGGVAGLADADGAAFGSLVILVCAGLAVGTGVVARGDPRGRSGAWFGLAVVFVYLAILLVGNAIGHE